MSYLDLVKLTKLMKLIRGKSEIKVGLIDGPVVTSHPYLESGNIEEVPGRRGSCTNTNSVACMHGTFMAGILLGKRNSQAPSICPDCTLLTCPIFTEVSELEMPSTTPKELAGAIIKCIDAEAQVLNLSVAVTHASKGQRELEEVLDYAARRNVIITAAAGNHGTIGSSILTRHPWVIPVAACDAIGRPLNQSNLGISIGRQGLMAPGENVTSLAAEGGFMTLGGTSIAAPFVTGTAALLWSQFPDATAAEIKLALIQGWESRRAIVPPLLDAWAAYQFMIISH